MATEPKLPDTARDLLSLWFGQLDTHGLADAEHRKRWFTKDPVFDDLLRERFGALHTELAHGKPAHWQQTPRGRLATILVLDQLSRNLYRDQPAMVAQDSKALRLAERALQAGDEAQLAAHERYFLYMPFMHAEELGAQERCVELFEHARQQSNGPVAQAFDPQWAVRHRDIIKRFGRFPHRNEMLGRSSTAEEAAFLSEPGSSF